MTTLTMVVFTLLLGAAPDRSPDKVDGDFDQMLRLVRPALCEKQPKLEACARINAFLAGSRPNLPLGKVLSFGRYVVLEAGESANQEFLGLCTYRGVDMVEAVSFPVRPENEAERADAGKLADKLAAG